MPGLGSPVTASCDWAASRRPKLAFGRDQPVRRRSSRGTRTSVPQQLYARQAVALPALARGRSRFYRLSRPAKLPALNSRQEEIWSVRTRIRHRRAAHRTVFNALLLFPGDPILPGLSSSNRQVA